MHIYIDIWEWRSIAVSSCSSGDGGHTQLWICSPGNAKRPLRQLTRSAANSCPCWFDLIYCGYDPGSVNAAVVGTLNDRFYYVRIINYAPLYVFELIYALTQSSYEVMDDTICISRAIPHKANTWSITLIGMYSDLLSCVLWIMYAFV